MPTWLADLAWWIAPVIAFGVAFRTNSLSNGIRIAGCFLVRVETAMLGFEVEGPPGWHVKPARDRREKKPWIDSERNKTNWTWYLVTAVTLALAVWVSFCPVASR